MVKKVQKVRKRDGREVDFDPEKISSAIFKATVCAHKPDSQLAKEMTGKVVQAVFHARKQDEIPTVEQIQDIVEKILMDSGHSDVAKSYILYRGERTALREKKELLGVKDDLKLSLNATKVLKKDGFKINSYLDFQSSNLLLETMPSTVGNGLIKISEVFKNIKPDFVFTVGDRYETMVTALATVFHNIPLCHTMGGERTGTIDESIRHSITKLAHLHFVSNSDAKKRLIKRYMFYLNQV